MRTRELERLSDLLLQWHMGHVHERELRDHISELRHHIETELESREDGMTPGFPTSRDP
jgi:hypothetical protein